MPSSTFRGFSFGCHSTEPTVGFQVYLCITQQKQQTFKLTADVHRPSCINSDDHDSNFCSCETTLFIIAPLIDGRIDAEATNQSSCIRTYSRTTPELWITSLFIPFFVAEVQRCM